MSQIGLRGHSSEQLGAHADTRLEISPAPESTAREALDLYTHAVRSMDAAPEGGRIETAVEVMERSREPRPTATVETIRHGAKQGPSLSEHGKEQAVEKARSLAAQVLEAPAGSVFVTLPSNIGRATDTARIIEGELQQLLAENGVAFVDVHDRAEVAAVETVPTQTCVITNLQPQHAIGYTEKTKGLPVVVKYLEQFGGDEVLATMAWAVRYDERPVFEERVRAKFPHLDPRMIRPKEFGVTPEAIALQHLRFSQRILELSAKHFPGRPVYVLEVGHNQFLDFTTYALLGREISATTLAAFGTLRTPIESARTDVQDERARTTFRNQAGVIPGGIPAAIERLKKEDVARRVEWALDA